MTVKARLHYAYGYKVGIGQVYGRPQYGSLGAHVESVAGFPQFQALELFEIEEQVDAVVGGVYGTPQYGSFVVRQAALPSPVSGFSIRDDGAYSPEFVEVDEISPELRILEDSTESYEFSEVGWPA